MNLSETRKLLTSVVDHLIDPQAEHYLHIDQINNNTTAFTSRDVPYSRESVVTVTELPAPITARGYEYLHRIQIGTTTYKIPKTRDALTRFRKKLVHLKDHKLKPYPEFSQCVASCGNAASIKQTIRQCMADLELANAYTLMRNAGIEPVFGRPTKGESLLYLPVKKIIIFGCEVVVCWCQKGYNIMEPASGLSISGGNKYFQSAKVAEYQTRERMKNMDEQFFKQKVADSVCHDDLEAMFCESVGIEVMK